MSLLPVKKVRYELKKVEYYPCGNNKHTHKTIAPAIACIERKRKILEKRRLNKNQRRLRSLVVTRMVLLDKNNFKETMESIGGVFRLNAPAINSLSINVLHQAKDRKLNPPESIMLDMDLAGLRSHSTEWIRQLEKLARAWGVDFNSEANGGE